MDDRDNTPDVDPTEGVPVEAPRSPDPDDQTYWQTLERLSEQERLLSPLAVSIADTTYGRIQDQEAVLRQVYRPLARYTDAIVAGQAQMLATAVAPLQYPIFARLAEQSTTLSGVATELAPTVSGRGYAEVTYPAGIPGTPPTVPTSLAPPAVPSSVGPSVGATPASIPPYSPISTVDTASPSSSGGADMSAPMSSAPPASYPGMLPSMMPPPLTSSPTASSSDLGASSSTSSTADETVTVCRPVPVRDICAAVSSPPSSPPTTAPPASSSPTLPPSDVAPSTSETSSETGSETYDETYDETYSSGSESGSETADDSSSVTESGTAGDYTPGAPTSPTLVAPGPVPYIPYPFSSAATNLGPGLCTYLSSYYDRCVRETNVYTPGSLIRSDGYFQQLFGGSGLGGWVGSLIDGVVNFAGGTFATIASIGADFAKSKAQEHGFSLFAAAMASTAGWQVYSETVGPSLPCGTTTYQLITTLGMFDWLERQGAGPLSYLATDLTYRLQYIHPRLLPSQNEVDRAFLNGTINSEEWACLTRCNGYVPYWRERVVLSQQTLLHPDQAVRAMYRGLITPDAVHEIIRGHGVLSSDAIKTIIELGKYIPPPSDVIHFLVKDAFLANTLGLNEAVTEYREQIGAEELFQANGITKIIIPVIPGSALASVLGTGSHLPPNVKRVSDRAIEVDVPLTYWLAHYRECSPTQVYEMLHRLRPNRVQRYQLRNPDGTMRTPQPVTMREVEYLLKKDDYHPIWRDRLAAISYRPIGRIDARRMYEAGILGHPLGRNGTLPGPRPEVRFVGPAEQELYEVYQDMGYSPDDAARLTKYTASQYDEMRRKKIRDTSSRDVCEAYSLGIMSENEAVRSLVDRGLKDDEAREVVKECDYRWRIKHIRGQIAVIRQRVIDGRDNLKTAIDRLKQIGIKGPRIADYIAKWELERERKPREVAAGTILRWYRDGMIDRGTAIDRLNSIGVKESDARLMLSGEDAGIRARTMREAIRVQREQERAKERLKRAREREIAAVRREGIDSLKRMLAGRSLVNLKQWLEDGTITPSEVRQTLVMKGWDRDDVERWLYGTLRRLSEREEREVRRRSVE